MFKAYMIGIISAIAIGLAGYSFAADVAPQKRKVVLQVSDNDEKVWNHAMNLAENMQANLGGKENIDIAIVAMSPGIYMVGNSSSAASRIRKAIENGVDVGACGYTMNVLRWGEDKLIPGVRVILPGGAKDLIDKQMAGWAYIKP